MSYHIWLAERVCGFSDNSGNHPCKINDVSFFWETGRGGPRNLNSTFHVDRINGRMDTVWGETRLNWQCSKVTPQTKKF